MDLPPSGNEPVFQALSSRFDRLRERHATRPGSAGTVDIVTLPSFQLIPSANVQQAIELLAELKVNCRNQAQPAGEMHPVDRQATYVRYATLTEQRLHSIVSFATAAAFFEGPRHRDICSMTPGSQLELMMSAEVDAQANRFEAWEMQLKDARDLLAGADIALVLDSSFYLEHPDKLRDVNFHELAQRTGKIKVLVPMVVVDELDGLKRTGDQKRRWRAGHSLGVIDEVVQQPPAPGILTAGEPMPPRIRGEVTLQIVLDPPGHQRLLINDDEIVDRALACKTFAGEVAIVTYDTGQSQRARTARLGVIKPPRELGPEPD